MPKAAKKHRQPVADGQPENISEQGNVNPLEQALANVVEQLTIENANLRVNIELLRVQLNANHNRDNNPSLVETNGQAKDDLLPEKSAT